MRRTLKFIKGLLLAFGALFIIVMVIAVVTGEDKAGSTQSSTTGLSAAATSAPRPPPIQDRMLTLMPASQSALVAVVESARKQYSVGANDMAKGAARPTRAQAICAALQSRSVEGWVGRVANLSSNGEGKGVLAIEIGPKVTVKTWNNSLSDIGSSTLIEPSSPLFGVASKLYTGQLVRFGGTLIQNSTDCILESSMSLAGSIREPDFIFRFRSVVPVE